MSHTNYCSCNFINKVTEIKYLGVLIDQRLSWYAHLELLMSRMRKLIWVFKTIRNVADAKLLKTIYISLAQSVLTYCVPVWGGAAKTRFLELERAQRSLIKVIYLKPYRYSTNSLYKTCDLLTVRQLYVLHMVLKVHQTSDYNSRNLAKRRKFNVATVIRTKTAFASRQYSSQSAYLYNKVNKILNIYPKNKYTCKKCLISWLKSLNYDETEDLIK